MITALAGGVVCLLRRTGLFPTGTAINSAAFGNKGDGIMVTNTGNQLPVNIVAV